ncbi:hypothetical protein [Paracoccus sp. (in: a-proteobacteria)]|uniref:hypothetical protein n=1 Tax=Paracoccus sp. TaxID=267 RepID=UPI00322098A6
MTRHLADHIRTGGASRVQNFTRQDRESGLHPAVLALHRRPHGRDESGNRRAAEFARIERGKRV